MKYLQAPKITTGKLEVYKIYKENGIWYVLVWDMAIEQWREIPLKDTKPNY